MKILLDENLDHRLAGHLKIFDVTTVTALGWSGLKNGVLLQRLINNGFTHLITSDKNIKYQQNEAVLIQKGISIVILAGPNFLQSHLKNLRVIRFAIKKHQSGFLELKYKE